MLWLSGVGARGEESIEMGHEKDKGLAYVGVRVEPAVRPGREVKGGSRAKT